MEELMTANTEALKTVHFIYSEPRDFDNVHRKIYDQKTCYELK